MSQTIELYRLLSATIRAKCFFIVQQTRQSCGSGIAGTRMRTYPLACGRGHGRRYGPLGLGWGVGICAGVELQARACARTPWHVGVGMVAGTVRTLGAWAYMRVPSFHCHVFLFSRVMSGSGSKQLAMQFWAVSTNSSRRGGIHFLLQVRKL